MKVFSCVRVRELIPPPADVGEGTGSVGCSPGEHSAIIWQAIGRGPQWQRLLGFLLCFPHRGSCSPGVPPGSGLAYRVVLDLQTVVKIAQRIHIPCIQVLLWLTSYIHKVYLSPLMTMAASLRWAVWETQDVVASLWVRGLQLFLTWSRCWLIF